MGIMSQKEKILKLLKERGANGATNYELNSICFRYGARIKDLRVEGYNIKTVREGGSRFKFVLIQNIRVSIPVNIQQGRLI